MSDSIETSELLKRAWSAVERAGIPESLWAAALPLAYGELRRTNGAAASNDGSSQTPTRKRPAKQTANVNSRPAALSGLAEEADCFEQIANETGVSVDDLGDVFHVSDGELHLKVASKDLGDNTKAAAMTVTSLLAGVVFASTDHPTLPISEIHAVCKSKRCHHKKHASDYVKATPSIAAVGTQNSEITHKSGWQGEFAKAVARVLGKTNADS